MNWGSFLGGFVGGLAGGLIFGYLSWRSLYRRTRP